MSKLSLSEEPSESTEESLDMSKLSLSEEPSEPSRKRRASSSVSSSSEPLRLDLGALKLTDTETEDDSIRPASQVESVLRNMFVSPKRQRVLKPEVKPNVERLSSLRSRESIMTPKEKEIKKREQSLREIRESEARKKAERISRQKLVNALKSFNIED